MGEINQTNVLMDEDLEKLRKENLKLGERLAVLSNVVEVSGYINSYVCKPNLIQLINDMIIGVLGAKYSTILLYEDNQFIVKSTNISENLISTFFIPNDFMKNKASYIINERIPINTYHRHHIHSVMGVPLLMSENLIGYIIVEHTLLDFFKDESKVFLTAIANQVAIAIDNSLLYKKLRISAETDQLLGIYNRDTFFKKVKRRLDMKGNIDYGIVMIDIDDFKNINDTYGHQFGDDILVKIANDIKKYLKVDDIIGRYGGEEIIVFIDDISSVTDVYNRLDKARIHVKDTPIINHNSKVETSISMGVDIVNNVPMTLNEAINVADTYLYIAKNNGKNKIEYYGKSAVI